MNLNLNINLQAGGASRPQLSQQNQQYQQLRLMMQILMTMMDMMMNGGCAGGQGGRQAGRAPAGHCSGNSAWNPAPQRGHCGGGAGRGLNLNLNFGASQPHFKPQGGFCCPPSPKYQGQSARGGAGLFVGGGFQYSRRPVFETVQHRKALFENYTAKEQVTQNKAGKMWDVWFDYKDGQKTKRRSPIVLDLNGNGKADITGKNITGDGKVDGPTTLFDIDPENSSYKTKSRMRRPGRGAPKAKGGHWDGKYYKDKDGKIQGEMKGKDYHFGNREPREKTEWLKKNGGDGLLVWDVNKDGKIGSSKELFGNYDIDGKKKFDNGYEKLAKYFDKNKDGKVNGAELKGLQIWKDTDANGKVDKGELQSLKKYNINEFDVANYDKKSMEGSFNKQTTTTREVTKRRQVGFETSYERRLKGFEESMSMVFGVAASAGVSAGNMGYW